MDTTRCLKCGTIGMLIGGSQPETVRCMFCRQTFSRTDKAEFGTPPVGKFAWRAPNDPRLRCSLHKEHV